MQVNPDNSLSALTFKQSMVHHPTRYRHHKVLFDHRSIRGRICFILLKAHVKNVRKNIFSLKSPKVRLAGLGLERVYNVGAIPGSTDIKSWKVKNKL